MFKKVVDIGIRLWYNVYNQGAELFQTETSTNIKPNQKEKEKENKTMKETIISRTIKSSVATVLKVNMEDRTVCEEKLVIDSKIDTTEKAMNYFIKHDRTVVDVLSIDIEEKLIGMTENDFLANGTIFEERGKENRGMISKLIKCKSALCMVVDKNRKVVSVEYPTVDEKKIRKMCEESGYRFVMIEKENVSKKLVCMSVEKFIELAKPMKDRFSLAK